MTLDAEQDRKFNIKFSIDSSDVTLCLQSDMLGCKKLWSVDSEPKKRANIVVSQTQESALVVSYQHPALTVETSTLFLG